MFVKQIVLKNFRNYQNEVFSFDKGLNIIFGKNAQGKTNLVEAIYFCSIGKSFKTNKDLHLINHNCNEAKINLCVEKNNGTTDIEILLTKNQKKSIKVNELVLKKIVDLYGNLTVVFFGPDNLKLIKDAPQDRRKFMDIALSQLSKRYFNLLIRYQKILQERNTLLKNKQDLQTIKETIFVWNNQLAETAKDIIYQRIEFIKNLEIYAKKALSYLSNNQENLHLGYMGIIGNSPQEIKEKILKELNETFETDLKNGSTSIGPHRDDIKILVNEQDVKFYGSQGQQRTVAISMKLAERELIYQKTKQMPIMILDDVFSELHETRKQKLIKFLEKGQTFITTTQEINQGKKIEIENGKQI